MTWVKQNAFLLLIGASLLFVVIWKRRQLMAEITGSVPGTPEELAASAGYDLDVYSLARVGQSEESGQGSLAVMWATKNQAKRTKQTITKLVTTARMKERVPDPENPGHFKYTGKVIVAPGDGYYGTQLHRYCATHKDPSTNMLEHSAAILSDAIPDMTQGSTHWDAPELQDKQHASDPDNHPSAEEVARRREAAGMHMVLVDGVTHTRFWR
jgi:hypothetical protein